MKDSLFPSNIEYIVFNILIYGAMFLELRLLWKKKSKNKKIDKGSMWFTVISVFLFFSILNYVVQTGFGTFSTKHDWVTWAGLILLFSGIVLRQYAMFVLGRYFTPDVQIQEGHTIIKAGPYRYLRHPSYTGGLLFLFSLGITLQNWIVLIIAFLPFITVFYRIRVEEKALAEHFGTEYEEYKKRTWRLIPFIY